jgi:hypothetical protein
MVTVLERFLTITVKPSNSRYALFKSVMFTEKLAPSRAIIYDIVFFFFTK